MSKKISISTALTITIIAMTVTVVVTLIVSMSLFDRTVSSVFQKQVLNNKIAEIDRYTRGNFLGDIDDTYLGDRVARGYIDGLRDSGSSYYSEREYTEMQEVANGVRLDIGIELVRDANGYFIIAKVHPGSPAESVGITAGGYILQIDGVEARNYTSVRTVMSLLRDKEGTTLELVCRYGAEGDKSFTIQHIQYTNPTVDAIQMVDGFAYVRISNITSTTYAEFDYAIRQVKNQGAKGVVFDIRNNSSTNYDQVYQMIDLICPLGTIARAEYKNNTTRVLATSDDENRLDLPMVVVVNGKTGGAAELFAASLRDLSGAQLVGAQTAGQGMLPSSPYRLTDGSAIVITIARLYTGNNVTWDGVGFVPEIPVTAASDDDLTMYNIDVRTDPQVVRAFDAARTLAMAAGIEIYTPSTSIPAEEVVPPDDTSLAPDDNTEGEPGSDSDGGDGTEGDQTDEGDDSGDDSQPGDTQYS